MGNAAMEPPLGRRLYLAHRAQHDFLDARMQAHGASLWNWVLLRAAAEGDGASQRELAERMMIEPPTLVRHLDKLVEEGLVERRRDEHDRRITRVSLTEPGRQRLEELHGVAMETDAELRTLLSPREVEVLGAALLRIHELLPTLNQKEHADGES
jgi:MarR family transcriptional regulator, transcriptional regulator for hemolysin